MQANNSEKRPLLQNDDNDLARKIKARIQSRGRGAMLAFLILAFLCVASGGALIALAYLIFTKGHDLHQLFQIAGTSLLGGSLVFFVIGALFGKLHSNAKKISPDYIFGDNLIGCFVYEKGPRWKAFAKHQWNYDSRAMKIGYLVLVLFIIIGAVSFGLLFNSFDDKLFAFAVAWCPYIAFGLLVLLAIVFKTQYQRFRKFRPEVHCLVLAKGCFYQFDEFFMIQHIDYAPKMNLYNLTSVHFNRQKKSRIEMPILLITAYTINPKREKQPIYIQAPVPEDLTASVASWLPAFAEPLGVKPVISPEFSS